MNFTLECEQEVDGRWIAEVPELPGVLAYGSSSSDAMSKAEILALRVIADRLENGESEPVSIRILPMAGAGCFIVSDIQKVLKAAQENNQIYDASGTPAILDELYEKTNLYLPDLHESWKSFFDFLFPKYSRRYNEADNSDVWSETNWESLVNHLKAAGVSLPSGGETTS